jgi:hypothetical protein
MCWRGVGGPDAAFVLANVDNQLDDVQMHHHQIDDASMPSFALPAR